MLEQLLSNWSVPRLIFFLQLRNIEPPNGLTRTELIKFVETKSEIPITTVNITPYILQNLTHQQLVNYLTERGYVVNMKAKFPVMTSDSTARKVSSELLKFALKDYETNIKSDPESYKFLISKIMLMDESEKITLYQRDQELDFNALSGYYKEINIDLLLNDLGANKDHINSLDVKDKLSWANSSIQFLVAGHV